jgi:DNA replication and repair protein RecF
MCPVVLFWPEDLQLVKAGPEGRRRLLDVLLSQLDPRAAVHLLRYRRVLEQRNALLHRLRIDGRGGDALPGFTHELAHHGARVVVARTKLVADLAPLAAEALGDLSSGNERLELRYAPSFETAGDDDERAESELRSALEARASEELARGVTVLGPHRDDIEILLDGRAARSAASQGQQRSIVLACKLAEMRHVAQRTGMGPVVLLDDVLSELDAHRRADLLTMLAAGTSHQVLVTATEALSDIRPFVSAHSFEVTAGSVTEVA